MVATGRRFNVQMFDVFQLIVSIILLATKPILVTKSQESNSAGDITSQ